MSTYDLITQNFDELYHYGIKGQKWGIRRFQNPDGTLTAEGRTRYGVEKLEKKQQNRARKAYQKKAGHHVFSFAWHSTGKNYDEVNENFKKSFKTDTTYKELSKKSFDAEKKRLMLEKTAYKNGKTDYALYEKIVNSKEYIKLTQASDDAANRKEEYVRNVAKTYVNAIKDAKMKDLHISEKDKAFARDYVSDSLDDFDYYDGRFQYNPDNYYEPWLDSEKFK